MQTATAAKDDDDKQPGCFSSFYTKQPNCVVFLFCFFGPMPLKRNRCFSVESCECCLHTDCKNTSLGNDLLFFFFFFKPVTAVIPSRTSCVSERKKKVSVCRRKCLCWEHQGVCAWLCRVHGGRWCWSIWPQFPIQDVFWSSSLSLSCRCTLHSITIKGNATVCFLYYKNVFLWILGSSKTTLAVLFANNCHFEIWHLKEVQSCFHHSHLRSWMKNGEAHFSALLPLKTLLNLSRTQSL